MTTAPKVLRRCTICKNFHASYLVEDPELGKCYLCLRCWKARSLIDDRHAGGETTPNTSTETTNDLNPLERGEKP